MTDGTANRPLAEALSGTDRPDPCTLLYKVAVSGPPEDVLRRALEVWVINARKAGWDVSVPDSPPRPADDVAGTVTVEGIAYTVRCGPRGRGVLVDDSTGVPVARAVLKRSVWAEPVVTDELLSAYP